MFNHATYIEGNKGINTNALNNENAACPGGEGAVLKTVGPKGLAGSNPVCGVNNYAVLAQLVQHLTTNQASRNGFRVRVSGTALYGWIGCGLKTTLR